MSRSTCSPHLCLKSWISPPLVAAASQLVPRALFQDPVSKSPRGAQVPFPFLRGLNACSAGLREAEVPDAPQHGSRRCPPIRPEPRQARRGPRRDSRGPFKSRAGPGRPERGALSWGSGSKVSSQLGPRAQPPPPPTPARGLGPGRAEPGRAGSGDRAGAEPGPGLRWRRRAPRTDRPPGAQPRARPSGPPARGPGPGVQGGLC